MPRMGITRSVANGVDDVAVDDVVADVEEDEEEEGSGVEEVEGRDEDLEGCCDDGGKVEEEE